MKKIKLLFTIMLAFGLFALNVHAFELNNQTGRVEAGGRVLFENGKPTDATYAGAILDMNSKTLTIDAFIDQESGQGIKIIDMGMLNIQVEGEVNMAVKEREDGIFISGTDVTIKQKSLGVLNITTEQGSGIIVDKDATLHIENVEINVGTIRYGDGSLDVWDNAKFVNTTIYKNGKVVELRDVTIASIPEPDPIIVEPNSNSNSDRKDVSDNIVLYICVAGLLIVCGLLVLISAMRKQRKK